MTVNSDESVDAAYADFASPRPASAPDWAASRSRRLRELLIGRELSFILEAHNGLSAKIVEQAGFPGIWASGLTMSAALGVRDCNEASWTQVLEMLEFMVDAVDIPILLDGDTGYGNFNNARRLVRKLCQRGVAGVCLEDKVFPKTNSFLGDAQKLADIDEFCGKLKASKDAQSDPDFCVVARVEALIAGQGMTEALRRAEAYRTAGADAILIHSKQSNADEILLFAHEWANRAPVVIVPTTYYAASTDLFREAGINLVIWANHNLRASLSAMRAASREIFERQNLHATEGQVAALRDIFAITGNAELEEAESRYLAKREAATAAIVLAAGRSAALDPLTEELPKCMLDVRGRPLLSHLVETLATAGINRVAVVRGYRAKAVKLPGIDMIENPDFDTTGEIGSLARAADRLTGTCIVSFGDVLFRNFILQRLLDTPGDVVIAVDGTRQPDTSPGGRDLVYCSRQYTGHYLDDGPVELCDIGSQDALAGKPCHGRWIGLMKLSAAGSARFREMLQTRKATAMPSSGELADLLRECARRGAAPQVLYINGHWINVNDSFDLAEARNFI